MRLSQEAPQHGRSDGREARRRPSACTRAYYTCARCATRARDSACTRACACACACTRACTCACTRACTRACACTRARTARRTSHALFVLARKKYSA